MTDTPIRPAASPAAAGPDAGGSPVLRGAVAIALLALYACANETGAPPPPPPSIEGTTVALYSDNVLSAGLTVRLQHADSVEVSYRLAELASAAEDSLSPTVQVQADSAFVPVLGLLPESRYLATAVAHGDGGTVTGVPLEFTTGALPAELPGFNAEGTSPAPGFVVLAAGNYGIVIDNTGRVVWYRHFPDGPGLNFMALNGRYAVMPRTPEPGDIEPWVEIDPLGKQTSTFTCANGLQARMHDVIFDHSSGGHWLMCDEVRTMDLTAVGGQAGARVTGTAIQHVAPDGVLLWQWTPFDRLAITDLPAADRSGALVNWTHGNAIDFDADGNLLVSFRSLNQIIKISRPDGQVLWRLGGSANTLELGGTASPPFIGQHGLRVTPSGLLLLDNRGEAGGSRVERYAVGEFGYYPGVLVAHMVQAIGSDPGIVGTLGGSVQQVAGGNVLVSLGNGQRVEEYDQSGAVVWRLTGGVGYVFKAQRIASLYTPGVDTPR